ncbi:MAG: hypothetical protein AB1606_04650 [Nitrospirota bacterium]
MFDKCPGAANIRTPTLKIKNCPECGAEIEIFSNDVSVRCRNCGFTIHEDLESCIQWCKYAEKCIGEETYRRLKNKKESE